MAAVLVAAATVAAGPGPADVATVVPTTTRPVSVSADDRAAWATAVNAYMAAPAERVTAHPAAADFPGAVSADAPPAARDLDVSLNLPRWHGTGLYAAPGARLTVRVSDADARRGLAVVIGSHTDSLLKLGKWVRFPRLSRRFPITTPVTTVANAFGGLVYVDVPRDPRLGGRLVPTYGGYGWLDEHPADVPGVAHVRIEGAIAAPLYVLGQTTPDGWRDQLRASAAPWGELASDRVVLTVQTKHLARVADPAALLRFWGKVIDAEADLAGWPAQPPPPERVVVDRDISAGWMHSGYPIMAHLASERDLLNLPALSARGDWGFFHELGHNHEAQAFTFGGDYVEVNVNLFSMDVMQQVVGREMTAHPALAHVDRVLADRLGPAKKADAWGNLSMHVRTIRAFGWPPMRQAMATYAAPGGVDGIQTRQQKVDQWVLRYSRATGQDLSAYYDLFDLRCGEAVRAQLKPLPTWMPADVAKLAGR